MQEGPMLVYQCAEGYMPEKRMEAWCINGQWTPDLMLLSCSKDPNAIISTVSTSVSSSTSTSACFCSSPACSEAGEQSIIYMSANDRFSNHTIILQTFPHVWGTLLWHYKIIVCCILWWHNNQVFWTYIPPTIQFVLGKGCFECYKTMGKNAIKSSLEGKMLIKFAILAKFESVKWIISWQNLFC